MNKTVYQPLILFDGVCNLCNSSVQFVIKRDKHHKFKFASLQSDVAKQILLQFHQNNSDLNSIILIGNNKLYEKSSAILRIFKILGGIYSVLYVFIIVPKPIRDWIYNYIAKNRYKWYGKKDSCMIPTKELKNKFID
jgi:predicted DCC family thiol-disulfide oxidoreductase YuxK